MLCCKCSCGVAIITEALERDEVVVLFEAILFVPGKRRKQGMSRTLLGSNGFPVSTVTVVCVRKCR